MQRDDKHLYNNPSATPVSKGGEGTWDGHQQMYRNTQKQLGDVVNRFEDKQCPDDPDVLEAYVWGTEPAPKEPNWASGTSNRGSQSNPSTTAQPLPWWAYVLVFFGFGNGESESEPVLNE